MPTADQLEAAQLFGGVDAIAARVRALVREACGKAAVTPKDLGRALRIPRPDDVEDILEGTLPLTENMAFSLMAPFAIAIDEALPWKRGILRRNNALWVERLNRSRSGEVAGLTTPPLSEEARLRIFVRFEAMAALGSAS